MGIEELQGYASFFMTIFLVILMYGYIIHLYKSEKKGERNYEQYGNIALDDSIDTPPIEDKRALDKEKNKEENK